MFSGMSVCAAGNASALQLVATILPPKLVRYSPEKALKLLYMGKYLD